MIAHSHTSECLQNYARSLPEPDKKDFLIGKIAMSINMENFTQNKTVNEFLSEFLKLLETKKSIILHLKKQTDRDNRLERGSSFLTMLDKGIDVIKSIQFKSVDDLGSVKKLRETELFFLETDGLKEFKFQDYKLQINPIFLMYVEIEMQLDILDRKALHLLYRGYRLTGEKASWIVINLHNLNDWYFNEKIIEYDFYKSEALELIHDAQSLSKHSVYEKILANLLLLILTLGTAFVFNKAVNGHFLFFQKTVGAEQFDAISKILSAVNQLSP